MTGRVARYRLRISALVLLGISAFAAMTGVSRLRTVHDLGAMLPDGETTLEEYHAFADSFGSDRVMALVFLRPAGFFESSRLAAVASLADAIGEIPWVRSVESITHTTSVASRAGMIEARPLFTDPPFDPEQVERGRDELLRSRVFLRHLVSPSGGAIGIFAFLDERTIANETVRRLPEEIAADPVAFGDAGRAVEGAFNDVGLALALGELEGDPDQLRLARVRELAGGDIDGGKTLISLLDRLAEDAESAIAGYDTETVETFSALLEQHGPEISPSRVLVGGPLLRTGIAERMALDIQQALLGSVVLVLLLTWLALRDPIRVPLPLGAALLSALWTLGICGSFGVPVDPTTIAAVFPAVALALACGTLLCVEETPSGRTFAAVLGAGLFLGLLGSLLRLSDVEAVRRFGTVVSVGSICGAAATVALVWAALPPHRRQLPVAPRRARRRPAAMLAVVAGLAGAFGLARLNLGVDHVDNMMQRDPLAQAFETAEEHLAGMEAFRLHLQADSIDRLKDPEVIAAVRALQDRLEERDEVDVTFSYVDFIEAIYDALKPQREEPLPGSRSLVSQLLLLFGSPQALAPFVSQDWDEAAVTVRATVGGGQSLRTLTRWVERTALELLPPDVRCDLRGELLLTAAGNDGVSRQLLRHASHGLILALALCMVVVRRVTPFLRLTVPFTMAAVAALGAANLGASSLGPVTLAIPWIGLAAGLPVALARAREGAPRLRDWLSLAVVGACFAPLMVSTLRFDAAVGIGVALGTAVAALFMWGDAGVDGQP